MHAIKQIRDKACDFRLQKALTFLYHDPKMDLIETKKVKRVGDKMKQKLFSVIYHLIIE